MDYVPDPDLMTGGEDPVVPKELREALFSLDKEFREEKGRAGADEQQLSGMRNATFAATLTMLIEGSHEVQSIVDHVRRASQSLKSHRRITHQRVREDPKIQVFRRDRSL